MFSVELVPVFCYAYVENTKEYVRMILRVVIHIVRLHHSF